MRRIHSARRLAAAALVPVLLTGVAACGNDKGTSATSATDATSQSSTDEDTGAAELSAGDEVVPADFTERMSEGLDNLTTARMSMQVSGQAEMSMEGDVDYTGEAPALRATMTMSAMPEEIEMVMLEGMMYVGVPGQSGKFMKIDISDPDGLLAQQMDVKQLTGQMDMREAMKTYSDGLTGVTFVGEEEVDGEDLNRYEITMDPSKVKSMKKAAKDLGEVTYDAWLDDDDVMRQMVMEMPGGVGTMTIKIGDLGADVSIQAPAADQLVEMPGM